MFRTRVVTIAIGVTLAVSGCVEPDSYDSVRERIVGGTLDTGHPAVPHLLIGFTGGSYAGCTGTLISPRVVLTAAHCLDATSDGEGLANSWEVYFGSTIDYNDPYEIETIDGIDDTFKSGWYLGKDDIGLVLLETEASPTPRLYNTTSPSSLTGQNMTLVGWGITYGGGGDDGDKRYVVTPLASVGSYVVHYGTTTKNTCQGDSGGPGFMNVGGTEKVVSITSYGYEGCTGDSGGTRVDLYSSWIANWVATNDPILPPEVHIVRPSPGATVGSFFNVEVSATDNVKVDHVEVRANGNLMGSISSSPYVFNVSGLPDGQATIEAKAWDSLGDTATDTITVTVDTTCDNKEDCSVGFDCIDGACVPLEGGIGDECVDHQDCLSGMCGHVGDEWYCSQLCDVEANDCPEGYDCVPAGAQGACVKGAGADDGGGGCAVGSDTRRGLPALVLLGLFGLLAVRRRRG